MPFLVWYCIYLFLSNVAFLGSHDGFLRLWKVDPKTKSIQAVKEFEAPGFINDLQFTSDGKYLFAAIGQEHRCGRWWQIKESKNHLLCLPLEFED